MARHSAQFQNFTTLQDNITIVASEAISAPIFPTDVNFNAFAVFTIDPTHHVNITPRLTITPKQKTNDPLKTPFHIFHQARVYVYSTYNYLQLGSYSAVNVTLSGSGMQDIDFNFDEAFAYMYLQTYGIVVYIDVLFSDQREAKDILNFDDKYDIRLDIQYRVNTNTTILTANFTPFSSFEPTPSQSYPMASHNYKFPILKTLTARSIGYGEAQNWNSHWTQDPSNRDHSYLERATFHITTTMPAAMIEYFKGPPKLDQVFAIILTPFGNLSFPPNPSTCTMNSKDVLIMPYGANSQRALILVEPDWISDVFQPSLLTISCEGIQFPLQMLQASPISEHLFHYSHYERRQNGGNIVEPLPDIDYANYPREKSFVIMSFVTLGPDTNTGLKEISKPLGQIRFDVNTSNFYQRMISPHLKSPSLSQRSADYTQASKPAPPGIHFRPDNKATVHCQFLLTSIPTLQFENNIAQSKMFLQFKFPIFKSTSPYKLDIAVAPANIDQSANADVMFQSQQPVASGVYQIDPKLHHFPITYSQNPAKKWGINPVTGVDYLDVEVNDLRQDKFDSFSPRFDFDPGTVMFPSIATYISLTATGTVDNDIFKSNSSTCQLFVGHNLHKYLNSDDSQSSSQYTVLSDEGPLTSNSHAEQVFDPDGIVFTLKSTSVVAFEISTANESHVLFQFTQIEYFISSAVWFMFYDETMSFNLKCTDQYNLVETNSSGCQISDITIYDRNRLVFNIVLLPLRWHKVEVESISLSMFYMLPGWQEFTTSTPETMHLYRSGHLTQKYTPGVLQVPTSTSDISTHTIMSTIVLRGVDSSDPTFPMEQTNFATMSEPSPDKLSYSYSLSFSPNGEIPPASNTGTNPLKANNGVLIGAIAGGVAGGLVIILIIILICCCCCCGKKGDKKSKSSEPAPVVQPTPLYQERTVSAPTPMTAKQQTSRGLLLMRKADPAATEMQAVGLHSQLQPVQTNNTQYNYNGSNNNNNGQQYQQQYYQQQYQQEQQYQQQQSYHQPQYQSTPNPGPSAPEAHLDQPQYGPFLPTAADIAQQPSGPVYDKDLPPPDYSDL